MSNCVNFCHPSTIGGSVYVSGTTCDNIVAAYFLNFGQCICINIDLPFITCENPIFSGDCVPSSPTPTVTPTVTLTPTMTQTPTFTPTNSLTPSITPSPTSTPIPNCCLASGFTTTNANAGIQEMFELDDFTILLRGNLTPYSGQTNTGTITRLDACGVRLNNYTSPTGFAGSTGGFARQSDGSVIIAAGRGLVRLKADYSGYDTTFTSGLTNVNTSIWGVAVNSSDEILITGDFGTGYTTTAGTISYNSGVYKLGANGVPDATFSGKTISYTAPTVELFDGNMFTQSDGKHILFGHTGTYGDASYQGIVRLNSDFTLDTSFKAEGFTGTTGRQVLTSIQLSNNQYLVGGGFDNYSGQTAQDRLIRLNTDGTLDATFDYFGTTSVYDLIEQTTGKIIVADTGASVFRINSGGTNDTSFVSGTTTTTTVYNETALMLYEDDTFYVAGYFDTYNALAYPRLVKCNADGSLNMCPLPSPTPTPTPSFTPTNTLTATLTPTNTLTPSPTATPACLTCNSIFYIDDNQDKVGYYDFTANTIHNLINLTAATYQDIAATNTKLFVSLDGPNPGDTYVDVYDIGQCPYSASTATTFLFTGMTQYGSGLAAINNTDIVFASDSVWTGSTSSAPTMVKLFDLPSGCVTTGDIIYFSGQNQFCISYTDFSVGADYYVSIFDSSGNITQCSGVDRTINLGTGPTLIPDMFGLFEYNGQIYGQRENMSVWVLDFDTLTYYSAQTPSNRTTQQSYGAASFEECIDFVICPTPSPTPTNTATPSLTPSQTVTPSLTPTNTNTPSVTPSPNTQLFVYARYVNSDGDLQYQINTGSQQNLGAIGSTSCLNITTIGGLTAGDTVTFTDVNTKTIAGDDCTSFACSTCPSTGYGCSYQVTIVDGENYVYLSLDGSINC